MYKLLRTLVLVGFLLVTSFVSAGKNADVVGSQTDSTHFVTASLVVITPGPDIYSVFGHTALRMECPSKGLDYTFSFESEAGFLGYLKFFAGQSHAGFVPVPTDTFLTVYSQQGRGVRQYELNLTPHEKQELWRALDNDMLEGAHRKFNLIKNNCTSMSMLKIESIMDNEYFEFGKMPAPMYYNNGRGTKWLSRRSPWAQFIFMSFLGSEADTDWDLENKLNPELIIPVLKHTLIHPSVGAYASASPDSSVASPLSGGKGLRPALTGVSKTLLPLVDSYDRPSPVTPNVFFGALLVLTVIAAGVSLVRRRSVGCRLWHRRFAWLLSIVGGAVSIFLLYVTLVSGLFGIHWNWLLIPFNPLPIVVWLCLRKRPIYNKVWWVYAAVLVAFIAIVPWLTTQLLPAHYLLVATIAVLCVWRAMLGTMPSKKIQKK